MHLWFKDKLSSVLAKINIYIFAAFFVCEAAILLIADGRLLRLRAIIGIKVSMII
jgi:hypothetical protein